MNPVLKHKGTTNADYEEVQLWCEEHCGEFDVGWYRLGTDIAFAIYNPNYKDTYYFADEKILTLFLLRWS